MVRIPRVAAGSKGKSEGSERLWWRRGEALEVRPNGLDLAAGAVRVLFAKGGAWRTVGIDAGAAAVLGRWLAAQAGLGLGHRSIMTTSR